MDMVMKIGSFVGVSVAAFATGYHIMAPSRRRWPKRIVSLLCLSILMVEISYTISAVKGYSNLDEHKDFCTIQGSLLNWSSTVMVLLLLWFHYIQHMMLCHQKNVQMLQKQELPAMAFIVLFSLFITMLPVLTHHMGTRKDFYACSVKGAYFDIYYVLMIGALIIANYWCFRNARWLKKVAESLDANDRPEMLLSLKRYQRVNVAIVLGTGYLFAVLLVNYLRRVFGDAKYGAPYFCFLISFDFLLFPIIFVAFVHGFSWVESIERLFTNSKPNKVVQGFLANQGSKRLDEDGQGEDLLQGLDISGHSSKWSDYDDDSTIKNDLEESFI